LTGSTFATATAWSYGLALAAYLAFAIRVTIGARASPRARLLIGALFATALWAAASLAMGRAPSTLSALGANIADALRYGAWLAFLACLLRPTDATSVGSVASRNAFVAVGTILVASVLLGEAFTAGQASAFGPRAGFLVRLGLAVFGLVLVEQLIRRVQPQRRWAIKPLAVGLAGTFGLDLFLYADAMLFGHLDPDIWVSRGLANFIVIPFLAVATARNTGWTIDLHLSRGAVLHSTALLISGAFLLAVAGAGYFVRYFGGEWGRALQIELLFAALLTLVIVASSGRFRAKLKVFVSKHFFSYRYDYREEWLRFTRTLSNEGPVEGLQERTITALANLVESPAGALWLKDDARGYVMAARWNAPAQDGAEPAEGALPRFLEETGWVVCLPELHVAPEQYRGLALPAWLASFPSPWLIIPLAAGAELLGFVVLGAPRTAIDVDWEVRDLLKTASRQAASYLGQVRASEALLEARKFDAFNRMSAFVVHDLKNLVAQLSLMLANAQRHRANPAFQVDMLATVAHVVGRMNGLMLQLRMGSDPVAKSRHVDAAALLRRVVAAKADARVTIEEGAATPATVLGDEARLEHVIGHLLQNAIDAIPASGRVTVRIEAEDRFAVIVVSDDGVGMTPEFIRDRLFKPFETTKASGMGIGMYESVQYVASIGGDIQVASDPGAGTRVRVRLPRSDAPAAAGASADTEQIAQ
jgi:putative PEP-CTERM system histidine kinase